MVCAPLGLSLDGFPGQPTWAGGWVAVGREPSARAARAAGLGGVEARRVRGGPLTIPVTTRGGEGVAQQGSIDIAFGARGARGDLDGLQAAFGRM